MSDLLRRIDRETGIADLLDILAERLEPTDLHSLLLELYRRRAERRRPADLLADYISNRFTPPGRVDPRLLNEWDRIAFATLPATFEPIELSPLSPLGTSSVVAGVSQNKAVVTARNLEVVSDATNVLALECAVRRRNGSRRDPQTTVPVKLAASHRLLRPQFFNNPQLLPHFRLFSLCSAGRDRPDKPFVVEALVEHIGFYLRALEAFLGARRSLHVSLTDLTATLPGERWSLDVIAPLREAFPPVEFSFDQERSEGRRYYRTVCFHIHETSTDPHLQLVDGGDVDWMGKLMSNAKERMVTSGVGSERVCGLQ